MADIYDAAKRSTLMSRVRSSGNRATELQFVEILRSHSFSGWRRSQPLPGRPDFVFRQARVAIFVDGCFWHRCPIHGAVPASNASFWEAKLAANVTRDRVVSKILRKKGWRVLRIWQHELARSNRPKLIARLRRYIHCPAASRG
jgi:DNA mismatch endonuclease (patch repair protein)